MSPTIIIMYQLIAIVAVIILFVKIWKMTNDVSSINEKASASFSFLEQANIQSLLGNADEAEKLLIESFIQNAIRYYKTYKNPEQYIDALEKKYAMFFEKIGRPVPDFSKYRDAEKYFFVK